MNVTLDQLADAIAARIPRVPFSAQLWALEDVREYLRVSDSQAREIVAQTWFPQPIRAKIGERRGRPRWKAKEVVDAVEKHR